MISVAQRRGILGLAFLGALTVAMMAPSEEVARPSATPAAKNAKMSPPPGPAAPRSVSREIEVPPLAPFERQIDEKFVVVDVFESRQVPGSAVIAAPPPTPLPPKLPFTYMGRVEEAGRVKYVLVEGEKLHIVARGAEFASSYRLEEVGAEELVVTYLPLAARQSMAIGEKK